MPEILHLFTWTKTYDNGGEPIVSCEETGYTWGHHRTRDHKAIIMIKLFELALTNFVRIPLIIIPYRIAGLIRGDYKRHGESLAKTVWINSGDCRKPNAKELLEQHKKCEINKELWNEIARIVTFPLELIALLFACVIGLIDPYDGRALYRNIENYYSRPKFDQTSGLFSFCEYTAPCMQDDLTFHARKNIAKFNYLKNDDRTLALSSIHRLEKYAPLFNKYLNVKEYQNILSKCRKSHIPPLKELKNLFKEFVQNEAEGREQGDLISRIVTQKNKLRET